jgi:hypothetical protein
VGRDQPVDPRVSVPDPAGRMSKVLLTTTSAAKLLAYAGLGLLVLDIRYIRRYYRGAMK